MYLFVGCQILTIIKVNSLVFGYEMICYIYIVNVMQFSLQGSASDKSAVGQDDSLLEEIQQAYYNNSMPYFINLTRYSLFAFIIFEKYLMNLIR